jgi:hypothetical protein
LAAAHGAGVASDTGKVRLTAPADALWIGGAQWAGKSSVANLLGARYPIVRYAYDYHDARSHADRARADPGRYPAFSKLLSVLDRNPDEVWVDPSPEEMAATANLIFEERFDMVLEDLEKMATDCVLLEGWGLRPHFIARVLTDPRRAVFLVPSAEFRKRQITTLGRARRISLPGVSDPERAQRNRVARDSILASQVMESAIGLGLSVIEVDGTQDEAHVTQRVEQQFRPFLPPWIY